jgi:hypothetical protein
MSDRCGGLTLAEEQLARSLAVLWALAALTRTWTPAEAVARLDLIAAAVHTASAGIAEAQRLHTPREEPGIPCLP